MSSQKTSQLAAGSKQGSNKILTPRSAAGSTQSSNDDCFEVSEPPSKKTKSSGENDECGDDITIPAHAWLRPRSFLAP